MLTICLITLGDPATLTGGYRYHRRMAELAARNDARIVFASLPTRLPFAYGPCVQRAAGGADVVLVDSIARDIRQMRPEFPTPAPPACHPLRRRRPARECRAPTGRTPRR